MDLACLCKGKAGNREVDCNCLLRDQATLSAMAPTKMLSILQTNPLSVPPQHADNFGFRVMACAGFFARSAFLPLSVW